ncbi:MAG: MMPL family transporter, partial [Methanomassiliicoccales archaeon]
GTIILLTTAPADLFNNATKAAILNTTAQLDAAIHDGRIPANATVPSLYSATKDYTVIYINQIGPLYSMAQNFSIAIPLFLFQVPIGFWESYNDTQDVLLMEYGVPEQYYVNWLFANLTGGTIPEIDARAYAATRIDVEKKINNQTSLNATEARMVRLYLADFTSAWNSTSADPAYYLHPDVRLDQAMDDGFRTFMEEPFVQELGPLIDLYLRVVHENFNLGNYQDFHRISQFNDVIFSVLLEVTMDLLPTDIRDDCLLYYHTFYEQWNSTGVVPTVAQFHGYADVAAELTAQRAGPPVSDLIHIFYFHLGWSNRDNFPLIHQLTITFLSSYTQTQPWLVQDIINLGDNPDATVVDRMADHLVANSTIPNYPLPMLPLIPTVLIGGANDSTIMLVGFSVGNRTVVGAAYTDIMRNVVGGAMSHQAGTGYYVTGVDPMTWDQSVALSKDLEIIDPVAIILILVLIGLFFNSILAAALPPAAIGIGLGISFAALYFIATFVFSVNFFVVTLMITASLGAGCDYCIFILSRYREERRNGRSKDEAVEEAVTWAGETVATSGATVIIGFGALFLANLDMIKSFGTLVIGIILALLISLTFIPSLLHLFGDKVFWPSKGIKPQSKLGHRYFMHSARTSIKYAKVLLLAAILVSVPALYLVATTPQSYDFVESMPPCQSKAGIQQMEVSFGGGMIQPTEVALVLDGPIITANGEWDISRLDAIENMSLRLLTVQGIAKLFSPTRPFGQAINYSDLSHNYTVQAAQEIAVMQMMIGKGNTSALVTIVFQSDPFSQEAMKSITTIRAMAASVDRTEPAITAAYVGGGTASMYDIASSTTDDFLKIIAVAILLIYIVLMFVLGSVLNPLRSILTILLSISWTIAITSLIFQWGMGMYLNFLVPLILVVICLGLGMDYDILLSTRIREEVHKGMSTNEAIEHSMLNTGGIITACGVVMASAFGSLLLTGNPMLMQFGMALMVAILIDATIVRTYLVPAIMSLMGKWNWWAPKRIQRGGDKKQ